MHIILIAIPLKFSPPQLRRLYEFPSAAILHPLMQNFFSLIITGMDYIELDMSKIILSLSFLQPLRKDERIHFYRQTKYDINFVVS